MEKKGFPETPEGAVIVALDSREEGLLYGAAALRWGVGTWLDYELDAAPEEDVISLFDPCSEAPPLLAYAASGPRVQVLEPPDRLLVFWNRGRRTLSLEGRPLPPDGITAFAPPGSVPWLLRPAPWLRR